MNNRGAAASKGGKDPIIFAETVKQYMSDVGLSHVLLRILSAKKHNKGYLAGSTWVGQVDWCPTDDESGDNFHVGEFLSNSEKAASKIPRLIPGKWYTVKAYNPDTGEAITTVVLPVGEEDEVEEEDSINPLASMQKSVQQLIEMKKAFHELDNTINGSGNGGGGGGNGPSKSGSRSAPKEELIEMDDGSFVTKEWVVAKLTREEREAERLREEISDINSKVSALSQRGLPAEQAGGNQIAQMVQNFIGGLLSGGGGGGGAVSGLLGIPMIDQLLTQGLGVLRGANQQTVGGPSGFDQSNPFSSLLAGIDLNSLAGTLGQAAATATVPAAPPLTHSTPSSAASYGGPPTVGQHQHRKPKPEAEDDMGDSNITPELKKLSRELFDVLFKAYQSGGEPMAKEQAAAQFVPLCRSCGLKDTEVMLMVMDARQCAKTLMDALPGNVKMFIKTLRDQIQAIIVDVIEDMDWNEALAN